MYRLHNTPSDHSGVTNMYSLQSASNTGNTIVNSAGSNNSRAETPLQQQQHQRYQLHPGGGGGGGIGGDGYLDNDMDGVRLVPAHNGGISHSYTLPHNLSHGHHHHHHHQQQQQQQQPRLRGSTDHLLGPPVAAKPRGGIVQQYMAQHGKL